MENNKLRKNPRYFSIIYSQFFLNNTPAINSNHTHSTLTQHRTQKKTKEDIMFYFFLCIIIVAVASSFSLTPTHHKYHRISTALHYSPGGTGWKNDNFLDSLNKNNNDDDDNENNDPGALNDYELFKKQRAEFQKRQQDRMSKLTPEQKLQIQRMQESRMMNDEFGDLLDDEDTQQQNQQSQSRFSNMMDQAAAASRRGQGMPMSGGFFEQKFAPIPLDDDEEDSEQN